MRRRSLQDIDIGDGLHPMNGPWLHSERFAGGKPIVISENGWPSRGTPYGGAVPGDDEALNYFINAYQWAEEEGIEIFYFSSFDETWKVDAEGDVGAYTGIVISVTAGTQTASLAEFSIEILASGAATGCPVRRQGSRDNDRRGHAAQLCCGRRRGI